MTTDKKELEKKIIDVLKSCYDPEIPVDIYELGLIYEIKISPPQPSQGEGESPSPTLPEGKGVHPTTEEDNPQGKAIPHRKDLPSEQVGLEGAAVEIVMTLTSPNCPVVESLPLDVESRVLSVDGVKTAKVSITFDPPWDKSMMSEEAQLELGFL